MPYNTQTKTLLAQFFHKDKNLIIKNIFNKKNEFKYEISNFKIFLLTVGIYYKKMTNKKSQIVVQNKKNFLYNDSFINKYFEINEEYKKGYPFTTFYDFIPEKRFFEKTFNNNNNKNNTFENISNFENNDLKIEEIQKIEYKVVKLIEYKGYEYEKNKNQENKNNKIKIENNDKKFEEKFCIILNDEKFLKLLEPIDEFLKKENFVKIKTDIKLKQNIIFLENMAKKDRKKLKQKNVFTQYLPISEKIRLKKMLENGQIIYSDFSINDIL